MAYWKALHIISVISWMAGLLYLFRLFVYHNEETVAIVRARFAMMERRLHNIIATPAALLTLTSGVAMITYDPSYYMKQGWFHTKLLSVILLLVLHAWGFFIRKKLVAKEHPYSNFGMRFLNEVPTLLMIVIVLLVVLKPF